MFVLRAYFSLASVLLVLAAGLGHPDVRAQQIYRSVGPDGKTTFSDRLPVDPGGRASATPVVPLAASNANAALPFELREAASRYPVILYTGAECGACGSGRTLLSSRGVPFTEKTVTTSEDIEALKAVAGFAAVPLLTVGRQQLKGFSEAEWTQYLDAAGYPKSSQLPAGYSQPPATPLVAVQQAKPATASRPRTEPAPAAPVPATAPSDDPSGIRF